MEGTDHWTRWHLAIPLPLLLLPLGVASASAAERFEVAAWVDHFDFAGVKENGKLPFDTETVEGCAKILDHVQDLGATTILWRNCAGATMRYPSRIETHHQDTVLDKRKIPDSRPVWGWVRYGAARPDLMRSALDLCHQRGLRAGVHWPFEETHWELWTLGGWNLEHPQYWGRGRDGVPWWGRCSLAYPEVAQHKLHLVQELLDRGMETLFIDTYRRGAWSPAYEYVDPVVAAWRKQYGTDPPPPSDPRWGRHVAGYTTAWVRQLRKTLDASGRKVNLMVGVYNATPDGAGSLSECGVDWPGLVQEGLIDTLVINWVRWDPKDPFESTRGRCREIMKAVNGRCRVHWPIRAYDFDEDGIASYCRATGLSPAEVAGRLMEMAWEEGAAGVSLECVDYNNYDRDVRRALRELAEGKCRWRR